jgi:hypothetical protein
MPGYHPKRCDLPVDATFAAVPADAIVALMPHWTKDREQASH